MGARRRDATGTENSEGMFMSKGELKALGVIGGICTIVAAVTDFATKKKWEEAHTAALVFGGAATILGAIA
jgi:hypothetical protein